MDIKISFADTAAVLEVINNFGDTDNAFVREVLKGIFNKAVEKVELDIVKILLNDTRIDVGSITNLALINASKMGHIEMIKLLMTNSRVDPSANNNTAFHEACRHNKIDIAKLLLSDARVRDGHRNEYYFNHACANGFTEIVKLFLDDSKFDPVIKIIIIFIQHLVMVTLKWLNYYWKILVLIQLQ